jgi:hypothetical protein
MTRDARLMSGIILITVSTIQYGGYFLLTSLMNKSSGYMENPLRRSGLMVSASASSGRMGCSGWTLRGTCWYLRWS